MTIQRLISILSVILFIIAELDAYKVIYALNCGGDEYTDSNGIKYEKDSLKIGTASDFGKHLTSIGRVQPPDDVLYKTERYHTSTFGYEIPLAGILFSIFLCHSLTLFVLR